MPFLELDDVTIHWREDGDPNGAPIVFSNSLGCDLTMWDQLLPLLPRGLRVIRYDTRGHGQSSVPKGPYSMGALVRDAERLMDHIDIRDAVFVGLSMGGMIAQGLAVKRLDLVRAVVLSNTGAKIDQPAMWQDRIDAVMAGGVEAVADASMERWFTRAFRESDQLAKWRAMYVGQSAIGFSACMSAISGTDFYTPTSGLRLPALGIAGSDDGSTPADLVREMIDLIPGSEFAVIRRAGHLPCIERPDAYADVLTAFLRKIGHV